MSFSKHITTITISRSNYLRLTELGKKGDSFDDIVGKLLDCHEHHSAIPAIQQCTEDYNASPNVTQVKETKK
jgi:predicted CopG family antitoxin